MINHNPYYKPEPPYYYTAYGIAVKHGFQGTEAEWLESLKGGGGSGAGLPPQTGNSGKYLKTDGSIAYWAEVPGGGGGGGSDLPAVTAADNGKFLRVVNGAWAAAEVPIYNGGTA